MRDQADRVRDAGLEVLGASFDSQDDNRAFAEKFDFPYPLLCDENRELGIAYGAAADTSAKYADRISYVIGEDGSIRLAYSKVTPKTHLDQILMDL